MPVGPSRPVHRQDDASGTALGPGVIGPRDEVAALDVVAGEEVVQRHVGGIEVVDERLAGVAVVDQEAVEPFLLPGERADGGRRVVVRSVGRTMGRGGDRGVIRLGAAVEGGQDVGGGVPGVQLVDVAPRRGADVGDEVAVLEPDLRTGVEVEVGHVERDAGVGASLGLVERVVGGDQVAIDGVAEVGEVEPAEGAVPVGAVALAPVQVVPRGVEVVGVGLGVASRAARRFETSSIRAYISSVSAYFALKFRQKPPTRTTPPARSSAGATARVARPGRPTRSSRGTTHRGGRSCPAGSVVSTARPNVGRLEPVAVRADHVAEAAEPAVRVDVLVRLRARCRTSRRRRRRRPPSRDAPRRGGGGTRSWRAAPGTGSGSAAAPRRGRP